MLLCLPKMVLVPVCPDGTYTVSCYDTFRPTLFFSANTGHCLTRYCLLQTSNLMAAAQQPRQGQLAKPIAAFVEKMLPDYLTGLLPHAEH